MIVKKTISTIWNQVKYFVAAAGVVVTIAAAAWGAALRVHGMDSADQYTQTEVKSINVKLDSVMSSVRVLSDIKSDVKELKTNVKDLKTGQTNMVNSLANHMAKDPGATKQDIIDLLKQFDEIKKNEPMVLLRLPIQ